MAEKKIYEYDRLYHVVQSYTNFAFRNFYRKIVIKGQENFPKDRPYIIAPNHQNALMDALVFVYLIKEQPVFMARADIFGKNKTIDKILYFMNIMPIFRIRDGYESLGKNEEYFEKAVEVLEHNIPLCLFAEGRHNDKHQQLPLVKGMFRIAFRAQERLRNKNLQIVPVGIDYEEYSRFGRNLVINIGKPIDVAPFYESYLTDPVVGINEIRNVVGEKMSDQMLNIHSKEHYECFYDLCYLLTPFVLKKNEQKDSVWNKFLSRKEIANQLDYIEQTDGSSAKEIEKNYSRYHYLLMKYRIANETPDANNSPFVLFGKLLLAILFLPLAFTGFLLNLIPFMVPYLVSLKIKDTQFKSTVKFVVGLVLFPLYYIILTIIGAFELPNGWWALAIPIVGYLLGKFAWAYSRTFRFFCKQIKYLFVPKGVRNEIQKLKEIIIGIVFGK
ncbi:1-acyl-sn-glycerol-3-phosphate acyltransferase [Bacteroidales bacterium OttesenSCG-928-C19]|nr:1-acyl-sn-glycerol-3-phosphate acyltransferase [Bacteroidales bacterium OttesenSCG-928-C19]